jgi:hypothetical protein
MRYVQNAMWYGMAYSAYLVNSNNEMDLKVFHKVFSKKVFDAPLNPELNEFLETWTQLHLGRSFYSAICNNNFTLLNNEENIEALETIKLKSLRLLNNRTHVQVNKNIEILESMYLSTEIMYVLSEGLLIIAGKDASETRASQWQATINNVIEKVDQEWDIGRYSNDPAKYIAKFPNQESSHILIVLRKLIRQMASK